MAINFKKIARSLTGISTPVFGLSWDPPESDREIVRRLIVFLEDRRALYHPYNVETPEWVVESIMDIRKELTRVIGELDEHSYAIPHLRAMRIVCHKLLNTGSKSHRYRHSGIGYEQFFTSLGEIRAIFGIHIAQLCVKYGVDIEGDLATILPTDDSE